MAFLGVVSLALAKTFFSCNAKALHLGMKDSEG